MIFGYPLNIERGSAFSMKASLLCTKFVGLLFTCAILTAQQPCRSTMLVTVLDQNTNQPIDGLSASDFHAKDKGREISIRSVASSPSERRIVFLVDRSGSMTHTSQEPSLKHYDPNVLEKLTLADALSAIPSADSVAYLAFSGKDSHQTEFMQPTEAMKKMPEILAWKPGGKDSKNRTALWDNLDAALRVLTPHKSGDLIVVTSDGGDNLSSLPEAKVRDELLHAGVPIMAMVVPPPLDAPREERDGLLAMLDLVKTTGGVVRLAGSAMPGLDPEVVRSVRPSQLIQDLAHQYQLEVDAPLIEKPEKWQLDVGPLESGKKPHLFYPRYLIPCAKLP